ncbi:MAG: GNAT family N-acetyltransferase [Aquabacterium sp.]|nr:GNAT family N-acetyltransferase [Ferruginibacter sp.]
MHNEIEIRQATSATEFAAAKTLILQYVQWLGMDLSFQNFDQEMETMPQTYGHPDGALFIALKADKPVGVAGIKRFNATECEVKRMFIQPESRGFDIGKLLLTECIAIAKKLNYQTIKLDTADFMKAAIKLYTSNGFTEIPAYRHNPHDQARYFELHLTNNQPV